MITRRILFIGGSTLDGKVRRGFQQKGFNVLRVNDFESAADLLLESQVDVVILNLDQTKDGPGFIRRIRSIPILKGTRVVAVARWGGGQATTALSAGADAYEPSPTDARRLTDAVERVLNRRAAVVGLNN